VKSFREANHPPRAVVNGDGTRKVVVLKQPPDTIVELNAGNSLDPDGQALRYRWWVYPEASTFDGPVPIRDANTSAASVTIPAGARGKTIHVILEVTDDGTPSLTSFRRVILEVEGR
jgi:hypothetical protein